MFSISTKKLVKFYKSIFQTSSNFFAVLLYELCNNIAYINFQWKYNICSVSVHKITAIHWPPPGTISCVNDRICFLPVTMTGTFSNFNSMSYKIDWHECPALNADCWTRCPSLTKYLFQEIYNNAMMCSYSFY